MDQHWRDSYEHDMTVVPVDGEKAGSWIEAERRRSGRSASMAALLPGAFDSYAAVKLPIPELHLPHSQEEQICDGSPRLGSPCDAVADMTELTAQARWLSAVEGLLSSLSNSEVACFAAVWTGYRWRSDAMHGGGATQSDADGSNLESTENLSLHLFGRDATVPLLSLSPGAGLDFAVYEAQLPTAIHLAEIFGISPVATIVPNMVWPEDRTWFMNTDVDMDESIIGGSDVLISRFLNEPSLDVTVNPGN